MSLQIRNEESGACLDTMGKKENDKVGLFSCHGMGGNQVVFYVVVEFLVLVFWFIVLIICVCLFNELAIAFWRIAI